MAKADVVVGARARSRGRVGEVVAVDDERALVTMRFDDAKAVHRSGVRDEELSEKDAVVGVSEVEVLPEPVAVSSAAVKSTAGTKPTQGQITAARRAAVEKARGERLTAQQLIEVQEEAEAELTARLGRGEPA